MKTNPLYQKVDIIQLYQLQLKQQLSLAVLYFHVCTCQDFRNAAFIALYEDLGLVTS